MFACTFVISNNWVELMVGYLRALCCSIIYKYRKSSECSSVASESSVVANIFPQARYERVKRI